MATEEAKKAYSRRKELPEPTFGIFKEQLGVRRFLLRGLANVKAELLTLATAFNLRTLWRFWRTGKVKALCAQALGGAESLAERAITFIDCPAPHINAIFMTVAYASV